MTVVDYVPWYFENDYDESILTNKNEFFRTFLKDTIVKIIYHKKCILYTNNFFLGNS